MKIARLTRQARGGGGADCEMRACKQVNTNGKVNKPKRVKNERNYAVLKDGVVSWRVGCVSERCNHDRPR